MQKRRPPIRGVIIQAGTATPIHVPDFGDSPEGYFHDE